MTWKLCLPVPALFEVGPWSNAAIEPFHGGMAGENRTQFSLAQKEVMTQDLR